jgi:outer membrane immunogenic protein
MIRCRIRNKLAAAASLGILSLASAASAEPLQPPSVWSGLYAGLFAGYGFGDTHATAPLNPQNGFFYNFGGDSYSFDTDGFFGGATFGYNWQSRDVVTGLEAEIGYLGLRGSALDPNGVITGFPDTETRVRSDLFGAISGRLGLTNGPALLYAKGGAAFLRMHASTIDPCIAPPAGCGTQTLTMSGGKTLTGWTIGGGIEWMVAPNWTLKAEYSYFDFGSLQISGASSVNEPYWQNVDVAVHAAKVGLNYRFAPGSLATKY